MPWLGVACGYVGQKNKRPRLQNRENKRQMNKKWKNKKIVAWQAGSLLSTRRSGMLHKAGGMPFAYNIRSWMKSITSPLFTETLYYNESYGSSAKRYNGNISAMSWKLSNESQTRGYAFTYDNFSRLAAANYLENASANSNYKTSYTYDKQGNVLNLQRYGKTAASAYGLIDNLTLSYSGNQLYTVEDSAANSSLAESADFKNYSNTKPVGEFTVVYAAYINKYNANGAMTRDLNKGISDIQYNLLNLPRQIDIKSPVAEARNEYTYSAAGQKLKVVQKWNPNYSTTPSIGSAVTESALTMSKTTDYIDNVIYQHNGFDSPLPKRILIDGGYIEGGVYHYFLTDHLGNNRLVADASGAVVQKNHYYPFGMPFADGLSPDAQPYKYNGKELDQMHGLNQYDYSARYYDPAIAQFTTMDPLCEKYYPINPYAYCANNPVNAIDPTGEDLYLFYYLNNNYNNTKKDEESNRMFWAAAVTHSIDIAKKLKDGDKAIIKPISSTSDFKSTIEGDITANKDVYGTTKEVGIWSHGGFDGPLRHDQNNELDQLPVSEWENINFNWSNEGASISFYGCQTGRENKETGQSFNERLSGYSNFNNVDVLGQVRRSWPSPYTNMRYITDDIKNDNHRYPTYMIGSSRGINGLLSRWSQMPASPMSIFRNGRLQGYRFQQGKRFY